jgi:polyisoprenoid-binding protein YceI
VTGAVRNLTASDGQLLVHTGVTGRAARMGHRLTIAMNSWRATVRWADDDEPAAVELTVQVNSLEVLRGEGGITPLSGPEKVVARSNALKSLGASRFPEIRFQADKIGKTADGYRLTGTLEIHGKTHPRVIDVRVEDHDDSWGIAGEAEVHQSEFGVKRYSLLMGSVKVADAVTVSLSADLAKAG